MTPDLESVIFTQHALDRLCERMASLQGTLPKDPEKTARRLLEKAMPQELNPVGRVKRLLSNGVKPANYFINSGWRFVVVMSEDERPVVVTIERERFKERNRQ